MTTAKPNPKSCNRAGRMFRPALLAFAIGSMAACGLPPRDGFQDDPVVPVVSSQIYTKQISSGGVSGGQASRVMHLVREYGWTDQDQIEIRGKSVALDPSGRPSHGALALRDRLERYGIDPARVRFVYDPRMHGTEAALVRYTVTTPVCDTPELGTSVFPGLPGADLLERRKLGCATAHNLATMVADPGDLAGATNNTIYSDGVRAADAYDRYRRGEVLEITVEGTE